MGKKYLPFYAEIILIIFITFAGKTASLSSTESSFSFISPSFEYRESYMSVYVLFNSLNKLRKASYCFSQRVNKLNNSGARM